MKEENKSIDKSVYPQQPYRVHTEELLTDLKIMFGDFLKGNVSAVEDNVSIVFTFTNGQKFLITVKELL